MLKMPNLFGSSRKEPTAREQAKRAGRETKREIRGAQRDLDRELRDLDRTEKQLIVEIKNRARQANVNPKTDKSLQTMSKNLVQVRNQKTKLMSARANLGAVQMHATTMATHVAAASAIGKVTEAMGTANSLLDPKEMTKTMNEFAKQNEMANIREEMMDDALTDAFDNDDLDEEADQITNQVLAELGLELGNQMNMAPTSKPLATGTTQEEEDLVGTLPDLKARLENL